MQPFEPRLLKAAVVAICPDVESRLEHLTLETDEKRLWRELSTCLLSSQVPYPLALAAADAIDRSGVLADPPGDIETVTTEIENVLRSPLDVGGSHRSYRFQSSKSAQLARTCYVIHDQHHQLRSLLTTFGNEQEAREWFVKNAPGIGPKQASMFLRNIGFTYQLAVLDRHVLNYMQAMELEIELPKSFANLQGYYSWERSLRRHAEAIGYPVGLLDWAIWIVMRAARELKSSTRE